MLVAHSGNLYGGIETALGSLARAARGQQDVQFEFALCFADTRIGSELRDAGVVVHDLGATRLSRPWTVWRARRRLQQVIAERRVDICITPSAWAHVLFAPVAARAGVTLVLWAHDMWTASGWLDRRALRRRPAAVIANSRYTADGLTRLFPGVPMQVVYCPAEPLTGAVERRDALRRELQTPLDAVVIVQVARLEPYKGHGLLIDALARLGDQPQWHCWFVGGTQRPHEQRYLDELQHAAAAAGIAERVRFTGARTDVADVLRGADVFCHPNRGPEPFGLVFIEAMAAGLPVVGSALGGVTEIVTDDCGRLVPGGDTAALASTLRELVESPALRRRLGAAGPSRARELCDPADRLADLTACLAALPARAAC